MAHQPAQILSGQRPVGDDADAFRPVGDFPRFTDGDFGRERLAIKPRQFAPAPNALFEDGMEDQGVEGRHKSNLTSHSFADTPPASSPPVPARAPPPRATHPAELTPPVADFASGQTGGRQS